MGDKKTYKLRFLGWDSRAWKQKIHIVVFVVFPVALKMEKHNLFFFRANLANRPWGPWGAQIHRTKKHTQTRKCSAAPALPRLWVCLSDRN